MLPISNLGMMDVSPAMMNSKPSMTNVSPIGGDMKSLCQKYMNYHVIAQTTSGQQFDGIIDGMDDEGITMLVPEDVDGDERQFTNGYGQNGYGRRRYRRFRRQRFPYQFLLPFLTPYPYYYPPYPYPYPYYPGYGYGGGY